MQKIPTVFWNGSAVQFLLNGWRIEGPQDSFIVLIVFHSFLKAFDWPIEGLLVPNSPAMKRPVCKTPEQFVPVRLQILRNGDKRKSRTPCYGPRRLTEMETTVSTTPIPTDLPEHFPASTGASLQLECFLEGWYIYVQKGSYFKMKTDTVFFSFFIRNLNCSPLFSSTHEQKNALDRSSGCNSNSSLYVVR